MLLSNSVAQNCLNDQSLGPVVKGCRDDFDFTLLFENVFLSILPTSIFLILSALRIANLAQKPRIPGLHPFVFPKQISIACYSILKLSLVILICKIQVKKGETAIAAAVLSFVETFPFLLLSYFEHTRSWRPSILFNSYLFLTLLFDAARSRTILVASDSTVGRIFSTAVSLKAVILLFESQGRSKCGIPNDVKLSPEETSGPFSLSVFLWLNDLLFRGGRGVLGINDLYILDFSLLSKNLHPKFWYQWNKKTARKGRLGLMLAISKSLGWSLFTPIPARLALTGFNFCQPLLINSLLSYLQSGTRPRKFGYGFMAATALIYLGISASKALYGYQRVRMQAMVRTFLVSSIFHKTTELKITDVDNSASATLMSSDAHHMEQAAAGIHDLWVIPIEFALALTLLQREIGIGSLLPFMVAIMAFASSFALGRASRTNRSTWMERIQVRVGSTANVISNMKSLKISGLAKELNDMIQRLRDLEVESSKTFRVFVVAAAGISWLPIYISPILAFAVARKSLTTARIFTAWSYLNLLNAPLTRFFQMVPSFISALTCVDRIAVFLDSDPVNDYRMDFPSEPPGENTDEKATDGRAEKAASCGESSWAIRNGSFGWKEGKCVLQNISISIPKNGLTLVVGPVASGKSTLCKALLGEIPYAQGEVFFSKRRSRVGYCDQVPFLPNGTIREIIVGFSDFDDARYNTILDATALFPDLDAFEQGDKTKVGTKGAAISGGQRQRIAIARALYARRDLFIFDDIFSGLDQKTEGHVFEKIFGDQGIISQTGIPALLCTHSVKHLAAADHIIALGEDGTIAEQGKYEDLLANEGYVYSLRGKLYSNGHGKEQTEYVQQILKSQTAGEEADMVQDESRQRGDFSIYRYYFSMAGYWTLIPFILFSVMFGFFLSFSTIWLSLWSNYATAHPQNDNGQSVYLGIYSLIQVMIITSLYIFDCVATIVIGTRGGKNLHLKALNTLMGAPLRFFTTTDTGITTNRFAQDILMLDSEIAFGLIAMVELTRAIGQAIVIGVTSPYICISYPILGAVLYTVQRFYLKTSRQLRYLDLESKSPLFTHFLETLQGLATVRAFGTIPQHLELNNHSLDQSQRPFYLLAMIQEWLGTTLGLISTVLAIILVGIATQLNTSSGFAGAGLISLMTFNNALFGLVISWTELETSIGAVSRLKGFIETVKSENLPGEDIVPPAQWPEKGEVKINGVSASYLSEDDSSSTSEERQLPLALRNIDIEIKQGEKVAVCGRTGSGKSSLIMLLLRLLDPVPTDSQGISIDNLPLHLVNRTELRSRIIALPQDTFFLPEGNTIRANLDPYNLASEAECVASLKGVGLWTAIVGSDGLDANIDPQSLSQGQKQLFSLARAILRARAKAKLMPSGGDGKTAIGGLLLLDEVSSNVDIHTDRVMQEMIRREFKDHTVIAVAHRLETVMDFDRVLIMENGEIIKSGPPAEVFNEIDVSRAFD